MSWQSLWQNRTVPQQSVYTLQDLIQLDGFDTGISKISLTTWQQGAVRLTEYLGIKPNHSVFEFGCGSGALLLALQQHIGIQGGGVDISLPLLSVAKQALPEMNFYHGEVNDPQCCQDADYAISHSVFQYFDKTYAESVLKNMANCAKIGIAILDVPNEQTKHDCEVARGSQQKNLVHEYYDFDWFEQCARELNMTCERLDNHLDYPQAKYRFGCLLKWTV